MKYLLFFLTIITGANTLFANFLPVEELYQGTDPKEIQIADMNGDKKNDIVFVDNGTLMVLYSAPNFTFGLSNNSAFFNGIGSFRIPSTAELKQTDFTFSSWINFGSTVPTDGAYRIYSDGTNGTFEVFYKPAVAKLYVRVYYADGTLKDYFNNTNFVPAANTWYHIGFSHSVTDRNEVRLKINNEENDSAWFGVAKTVKVSDKEIMIGGIATASTDFYFNGYIDEVSYFSKALTDLEMLELYNNGSVSDLNKHSAVENLVSWWTMGDHVDDNFDATSTNKMLRDVIGKNHALPADTSDIDKVDNTTL